MLRQLVNRSFIAMGGQAQQRALSTRVFTKFNVYKGGAALSMLPISPTLNRLASGDYAVERNGVMLLEFANSTGERSYNWAQKKTFALSATEMGELIAQPGLGQQVQFYHEPLGGQQGGGGKTFRSDPTKDGAGFFFSLTDKNDKVLVPVTMGEFVVIKQLMQHAIPYLVAFDMALQAGSDGGSNSSHLDGFVSSSESSSPVMNPFESNSNSMGGDGGGDDKQDFKTETVTTASTGNSSKTTVGQQWLDQL